MCTICAAFRPFTSKCDYESLAAPQTAATIIEGTDAPASTGTSYSIGVGDTFNGNLGVLGDEDYVAIQLTEGESYIVTLDGVSLFDPYLTIYDAVGNAVTFNDDAGGTLNSSLALTAAYTGTYYLGASAYADSYTGTYNLTIVQNTLTTYTYDEIALQLTNGYWDWSASQFGGSGGSRSHNVAPGGSLSVNVSGLDASGAQLAAWAMEAWSDVLDISFTVTTGSADITFTDTRGSGGAQTAYASSSVSNGVILSSTVNVSDNWSSGSRGIIDGYAFQTYIHEIGHALGLGHGGNYNGNATYGTDNQYLNDSWQATVMSYFDQNDNGNVTADFAYVVTPMIADMIAVHNLYGTPTAVRTGDTVYGYNTNVTGYMAEVFGELTGQIDSSFVSGNNMTFTIYDNGGEDTIDYRTDTQDQTVDLRQEAISDVYGLVGNMSIARGADIENYIGGSGDDTIIGNDLNNRIEGGDGDDTVQARDGRDTVIGGSDKDDLSGGDGYDTLKGGGSKDTLRGGKGFDMLEGGAGYDRLYGGNGQDVLDGGVGNDKMTGGNGKDDFIFVGAIGMDTITDFDSGSDELMLSQALWSGTLSESAVVSTFASVVGSDVVFDFGNGDMIVLEGLTSTAGLAGDIVFV